MMIALFIVGYILTLVFIGFLVLTDLREEKGKVTVGDILTGMPFVMYVPIINTIILIIAGIACLVWEVFGVGTLCKKLWDKVKDIEL
jgi:Na+(H+)/acetate symporter ActP